MSFGYEGVSTEKKSEFLVQYDMERYLAER
jgi:hypothetical protein